MRSRLINHTIAAAALALAILLRWLLDPILGDALPLVTLFGGVAAAAWTCGVAGGVVVAIVGYLLCDVLFVSPRGSLGVHNIQQVVGALAGFATCGVIIAFCEAMRRAQRRAETGRETLRVTLASMGDAVVTTDAEGLVTSMNAVAEQLTGWRQDEAAGRPLEAIFRIINEYSRATVANPVDKVLSSGQIVGLANHTTLIAKDGTERSIDDSAAPIRSADGEILGVVLIFRDVTERRRNERTRRRLAALVESSTDVIIGTDLDGVIVSWNKAAEKVYGYTAAEAIGKPLNLIFVPELAHVMPEVFESVKRGEAVTLQDTIRVRKDGQRMQMAESISPVVDEEEAVIGASSIGRDIGDRMRAEEALRRSEERLRLATQTGKVGLWEWEIPSNTVTWTESLYEIHGVAPAEFAQTVEAFAALVHEEDREGVTQALQSALAGQQQYEVTFRAVRPDGSMIWLFTNAQVVREGDRPVRMLGAATDISELKRTEARLNAKNARLSTLSQAAGLLLHSDDPDAMLRGVFGMIAPMLKLDAYFNYIVDDSGVALRLESCAGVPQEAQDAIRRLEFGQALSGKAALLRQPIVECDIQNSDNPHAEFVKLLGIRAYVCNPLQINSHLVGTLSFASRSRDSFDAGEIEFMRTICHYVSMAHERLRLVRELREADRRKDEFLATLAHELRNPLAPVRTSIQIMNMTGRMVPELKWAREVIDRQMQQMSRLIDDLMDVSRINQGRIELRREHVDLTRILQCAVETSRPVVEVHEHELTLWLPEEALYVDADLVRMAQVFSNLLNNAAKFTEPGGRITLAAVREGSDAVVSVRDTGIGIPPDNLASIFEMFSQVERSHDRSKGGLGIGLALAKRLVNMHGGTIEARSDGAGKGSEFVVRLPLLIDGVRIASRDDAGRDQLSSRLRILIVDDNRDAADSLAMMLRIMGNEIATAYDGEEAVACAESFRPQVVLLDLGLPKLNGLQACRQIREHPCGKDAVLIAVTGWGQDDDHRRTREAGFDRHMVKPVDPLALMRLLAEIDRIKV